MLRTFELILILTFCVLMSSCGEPEYVEVAIDASKDNKITEKEFKKIIAVFESSNEDGFKTFIEDDGKVDNEKIVNFLVNFYTKRNLAIIEKDIWSSKQVIANTRPFNINVFVENSASMDGYVKGSTEFETAIYNLLGDFKISGICNQLNLSYINNSIRSHKNDALSDDIQDFIFRLEPSTFAQRRPAKVNSDMQNILKSVLANVDNNNVSVLISDFVFSPGSQRDAQDYLDAQSVGIKIDFSQKLRNFDLSAIVIQLESKFNGTYFDKKDALHKNFNSKRPYYVWILGNSAHIQKILDTRILDNIKGGLLNRLVMSKIKQETSPNFKILLNPKIGEFSSEEVNKKIICEAECSVNPKNKGMFGFSLAVDFSKSMQDKNYFLDQNNFHLNNNNYKLKSKLIDNPNDISKKGFTHIITLETNKIQDETLKIDVIGTTPSWVYKSSSIDDTNIESNPEEKKKTYGLKSLIEGVNDAFYPPTKTNTINSIKVTIKQ